jgi:tetratricopeptide (TPR) repeat protein
VAGAKSSCPGVEVPGHEDFAPAVPRPTRIRWGRFSPASGLSLIALSLLIGLGAFGVTRYRQAQALRYQAELEAARLDREAGRTALAARRLTQLAEAWPQRADLLYELGRVEQERGRSEAAFAWWDRIPDGAPEAARAAAHRAEDEMVHGRFTAAEERLRRALSGPPSPGRFEAREALVRLLRTEGRFAEARRLYLEGVTDAPGLVRFLRRLQRLDAEPFATEGMASYLAEVTRQTPNDPRVRLAQAHLALAQGRLEESGRLLDSIEKPRVGVVPPPSPLGEGRGGGAIVRSPAGRTTPHPDPPPQGGRGPEARPHGPSVGTSQGSDPALAEVRLAWALAAGRPDVAWDTLSSLPADEARAAELAAFFAAARGDAEGERLALERWLAINPAAVSALTRLAALAAREGRADEADRLRERKAQVDRDHARHFQLLTAPDMNAAAAELARLCDAMGRPFEAVCWRHVAGGGQGPRPDPPARPSEMLAASFRDTPPPFEASGSDEARPRMAAFRDDAQAVGLQFAQDNGDPGRGMTPPVTSSGGVALLDYDGDGWLDVYCVQGGVFPPSDEAPGGDRLYRNRGDGTFEDVSESAGIAALVRGYGHGAAVGDFDNDGHPDLFLTRWRAYQLLRSRGDGTFEDATEAAALVGDRDWPTSAAFADLDDDGDLDLYVCHYLKWDVGYKVPCVDPNDPTIYRCQPRDFPALPDHVFRNDAGRFVDVTAEAGFTDPDGRGLGVVAADADGDGKIDLFVANDTTANYLFKNLGGFRFEEVGASAGVAANARGGYQAGMGVACADLDGDGRPDLLVTNFYDESTTFFRNLGDGLFADATAAIGLAVPSRYLLGFGIVALDANADGRLDLLTANGHVHDGRPSYPWAMPAQLLLGTASGRLVEATDRAGPPFRLTHIGRALASGDLDNDGRADAVLIAQNEPLVYLHNQTEGGHSVTLALEGTRSNRDGIGAVVTVEAGGRRHVVPRCGGGSYQSASDPRLHVGLGEVTRIDRITVRWPSGTIDEFSDLSADAGYRLREGSSEPQPLAGFRPPEPPPSSAGAP